MYIRKCERRAIYRALFENGVLVAFKDHHPKRMHRELKWVPNLHVIKIMQSLLSRKLVTEIYSWNWYYWTLTNDGIIYLRTYLHISDHLLPSTLISRVRVVPIVVPKDGGFPDPRSADDRGIFRRLGPKEGSSHKRDNVGPGTDNLEFRGGFGRMA
ncbi:40S ribosomal protein S10b-like [Anopheles marshallii]|uniref:40S ribosomal protein S10b-like n=1 Tax=Anopheles marshallii TaxID=1521116 RepID=UPI00237A6215|nr:40S ribosomal protein S10b-like [Anopheles marshallii]